MCIIIDAPGVVACVSLRNQPPHSIVLQEGEDSGICNSCCHATGQFVAALR